MWILFKLIAIAISGLARLFGRHLDHPIGGKEEFLIGNSKVYVIKHKNKSTVVATSFAIDLAFSAHFKLTKEGSSDQFFKNLGLTKEFQTGDPEFDDQIYISSDSKSFFRKLSGDATSRQLVLKLFTPMTKYIKSDGRLLIVRFAGDRSADLEIKQNLVALKDSINSDRTIRVGFFDDPFVWKALVAETLVWSFFGYTFAGFAEWMFNKQDYHLDGMWVVQQGVMLGVIAVLFLLTIIILVFNQSSRGHRIIVESALLFGLSMPIAGVNILADLNINFDSKPSIIVEGNVIEKEQRRHRTRRGHYYTYHLTFNFDQDRSGLHLPRTIQVENSVFNSAPENSHARIEVGPGFMGHPWYRKFSFN